MDGTQSITMTDLISTDRFVAAPATNNMDGRIRVSWIKTLWLTSHLILGVVGLIRFPQLDALLVFLGTTALTICAGHSVGMHRLLIHRSFDTHKAVEYLLVWLGTLVGMAGPIGMIKTHDLRDWHQRQTTCPAHPAHQAPLWKDAWWQLCCTYDLITPPKFHLEPRVAQDRIYALMEKTWMLQQGPVAIVLFLCGGWAWVLWGISLRIAVSLIGHWMVGHFAHRRGHQGWIVSGLPVQGYNLPGLGLITFGENWHGNHHAFPHSANLGVDSGQVDPGYQLIRSFAWFGLAWNVKTPSSEQARQGLTRVDPVRDMSLATLNLPDGRPIS